MEQRVIGQCCGLFATDLPYFFPYIVWVGTFVVVLFKNKCCKLMQIIQCIVILLLLIARLLWVTKVDPDLNVDITEIILCYCLMTDIVYSAHSAEEIVLTKLNRVVIWVAPLVLAVLSAIIWLTDSQSKAKDNEMGIVIEASKLFITAGISVLKIIIYLYSKLTKVIRFCVKSEDDGDLEDSIISSHRNEITGTPVSEGCSNRESAAGNNDEHLTTVRYLDPAPVEPSDGIFMALRDKLKTHKINLIKLKDKDFQTKAYGSGPVMVICHFMGRFGENIETTLKEIKCGDYQRVFLIVMHCTAKHCLPAIPNKEKITSDSKFKDLVDIVDMGCLPFRDTAADIYDCPLNKKALQTIDKVFLNQSH